MFLSRLAEKSGIFDFLAPATRTSGSSHSSASTDKDNGRNNRSMRNKGGADGVKEDKKRRYERLKSQQEMEKTAERHGVFAKQQRVRYHNKSQDTHHDAVIVGVHFDDGPDRPYYTIKYSKKEIITGEDNTEKEIVAEVEKQTQPDRLSRVPWDENKSWEILRKK